MRQLEDDLNFISSLPDRPAMATADLKREFDKAGNRIKTYINSIMLPDLVDFQTNIETTISTQIGGLRTELEEDMTTLHIPARNLVASKKVRHSTLDSCLYPHDFHLSRTRTAN